DRRRRQRSQRVLAYHVKVGPATGDANAKRRAANLVRSAVGESPFQLGQAVFHLLRIELHDELTAGADSRRLQQLHIELLQGSTLPRHIQAVLLRALASSAALGTAANKSLGILHPAGLNGGQLDTEGVQLPGVGLQGGVVELDAPALGAWKTAVAITAAAQRR